MRKAGLLAWGGRWVGRRTLLAPDAPPHRPRKRQAPASGVAAPQQTLAYIYTRQRSQPDDVESVLVCARKRTRCVCVLWCVCSLETEVRVCSGVLRMAHRVTCAWVRVRVLHSVVWLNLKVYVFLLSRVLVKIMYRDVLKILRNPPPPPPPPAPPHPLWPVGHLFKHERERAESGRRQYHTIKLLMWVFYTRKTHKRTIDSNYPLFDFWPQS